MSADTSHYIQFQAAWVELATDGPLRRRFRTHPREALAPWMPGAAPLVELPFVDLERYAQSLVAKRALELSRAIPLTLKLAPDLVEVYRRWLDEHPAPPGDLIQSPGIAEGIRALAHLKDHLRAIIAVDGPVAPYAPDVLVYELYVAASIEDGATRTFTCDHRADLLVTALRSGELPVDPQPVRTAFRCLGGRVQWQSLGGRHEA
ncbi:MAG: hypothetical protein ACE366_30065 [Bradymonadia bacterium]